MKLDDHDINVIKSLENSEVMNQNEEAIGFIYGLFSTSKEEHAEYIVLGSDYMFGSSTRYFAVPVCTEMIEVSDNSVVMKIDKDDLMQTKRISFDKCPKPIFDLEPLIYELSNIHNSNHQKLNPA